MQPTIIRSQVAIVLVLVEYLTILMSWWCRSDHSRSRGVRPSYHTAKLTHDSSQLEYLHEWKLIETCEYALAVGFCLEMAPLPWGAVCRMPGLE